MRPTTMTMRNDWVNGHFGTWQNGMFVAFDNSHGAAITDHNDRWDGRFTAPCPHGRMAPWRCRYGVATQCLCECRGGAV